MWAYCGSHRRNAQAETKTLLQKCTGKPYWGGGVLDLKPFDLGFFFILCNYSCAAWECDVLMLDQSARLVNEEPLRLLQMPPFPRGSLLSQVPDDPLCFQFI